MASEPNSPAATEVEMNQLVLPQHTNSRGTAFGGPLMSWSDGGAGMSGQRQLVCLRSMVNYVVNTSMEVGVCVEAEDTLTGDRLHAASAYVTFVALDSGGKPTKVRPLEPQTPEERLRHDEAKARRAQRLALAKERARLADNHR